MSGARSRAPHGCRVGWRVCVLFDEGMLHLRGTRRIDLLPYGHANRGTLLLLFRLTHDFSHWHAITAVFGFLGLPT